ncbi:alkaline phosphatase D family protein [Porphyrobacter sp. CACIAM 03H1]|uniref:alkaline phosphatase D family protein n=1 Tax=Porphyrobacter sp. CACIAM 03H1 TaxID=2003315 RepID=UPI000B5A3298|nr:alkaline phosphatase D family protein [Porphyrobacter sp. CACIAM 03H1]ASJ89884.1 alkaline phosphatase [Porphyrobacter sp. CACIAM 03H1]
MFKTDTAAAQPAPSPTALTRRSLFTLAGASAAAAAAPAAATGFGTGFTHNVASGEPGTDKVMLWTRYVSDKPAYLAWEMSETEDFAKLAAEGSTGNAAGPDSDYCVKTWADGLMPGRWYFYRFIAPDGTRSPVGRTRTLPDDSAAQFRLAVFSCSNFGFGWFSAYGHAVEANDADLAVHLGDYIYEYGAGTYPDAGKGVAERVLQPSTEIVALTDYRLRYATYRADPDLQRLHQVMPMVAVWDDHETANDSWKDGAQNHQSDTEGDWAVRKAAAKKAYREWMPVSDEPYAAYQVGQLATLLRIDTRLEGRDQQLSLEKIMAGNRDPQALMAALATFRDGEWSAADRQLLGERQEKWLGEALAASTAKGTHWQVLVQQVLIGNLRTPKAFADQIGAGLPDFVRRRLDAAAAASQAGLPSNMDAWDGYPAARARVFEAALKADANLFVLAGDTHNAWGFELAHDGDAVGVELGVCSVSSPGFESYLSFVKPQDLAAALVAENAQLKWADTAQRGYMVVELTPARATTEYRFVEGIRQRSTRLAGTKRITTEKGSGKLTV